ncbi:hypothetical protein LCGC14_2788610, partial [marine sediment metagenome]
MNEHSATIEDLAEKPQASVEATHVWLPPNAQEVPDWAWKKYPNSRFYWRGTTYAEEKGIGRWDVVEDVEKSLPKSQADRLGRAEDTRVKRGDSFLCYMPEGLAQEREKHYHEVNIREEQTSVARLADAMQGGTVSELTGEVTVEEEVVSVEIPPEAEPK